MSPTTVIIGASVGGVRTAQALRAAGYAGEVVLVGAEAELPYDKPPLSKGVLVGAQRLDDICLLTREAAERDRIRLRLGRAAARLDPARSRVVLDDGAEIPYDDVVIATGAGARPSPWGTPKGLHVLRSAADAVALRADLLRGGPVVVIGGGFIGAEVACAARALGRQITVVDPAPVPMSRVLGDEIGESVIALHHRNGVATRFGIGVETVTESASGLTVNLTNGEVLAARTVVVGIGADPNVAWLTSAGLLIDDGVVCDEHGRAVGAPRVYAVGDVARWWDPGRAARIRVEHWTNAVEQAAVVAHNIVHPDDPRSHAPIEYVWSDQHDWKIQIVGHTAAARERAVIGDTSAGPFAALYSDDGRRFSGAVVVNWPKALIACRRALAARTEYATVRANIEALRTTRSVGVRV